MTEPIVDEPEVQTMDLCLQNSTLKEEEAPKITEEHNGNLTEKTGCSNEDNVNDSTAPPTFAVPLSFSLNKKPSKLIKSADDGDGKGVKGVSVTKPDDKGSIVSPKNGSQKSQVCMSYNEPDWSAEAHENYSFDVLKNGTIINNIPLKGKSYFIFGRLQSCDVTLEHPSLSRYHAVIQYSNDTTPNAAHIKGWYVYDLDSTHGTWVNKRKVRPNVYHRIKVGHIVKFGGSSRLHILQGPEDDSDVESDLSITEMKEQKERQRKEAELLNLQEKQKEEERDERERRMLEDKGCAWGMGEDAVDEGEDNPFASLTSENESLYIDDPKKALKGFYEREGLDLPDYQFTDVSTGSHKCTLEIPVDGPNGEELIAEAVVSGKKKDAVVACALEACRMLDKLGMFRSSTHESRKRKDRNWEDNDFYDSDEDTFLDRTGTIEKKRTMRMKKAGKESVETYDSLMEKYSKVTEQIQDIEKQLEKAKAESEALASEEMDELEAYMVSIKSGMMDSKTRLQLKGELLRLKMDEQNLCRLVNLAKPASLPTLKPLAASSSQGKVSSAESLSRKLQHLQKQKQLHKKPLPAKQAMVDLKPDEYEEDDQDDEGSDSEQKVSHRIVCEDATTNKAEVKKTSKTEKSFDQRIPHNESLERLNPCVEIVQPQPSREAMTARTEQSRTKKSAKYFSTSAALGAIDKQKESSQQMDLDSLDPKFTTWLPPKEQTGDGRTSLNDKFGY